MENKRMGNRRLFLIPALALLVILLGLLMMSAVFSRSQRLLADGQDGQLLKTAQSVDNNIMGHFAWYCSDLEYITTRTGFLRAEETYLSGGGADSLLYYLRESPLPKTAMVESILVLRRGAVALSTGEDTDYTFLTEIGQIGAVGVSLWTDGAGRPCVALTVERSEVGYAALIDGEAFFALAEEQTAAEDADRILLLDAQGQFFFRRTPEGIRIDAVDSLDPNLHSGLQLLLSVQQSGQLRSGFFRTGGQSGGESYTARMTVLPAPGNENGCFTVGVARNYDQVIRPYRLAAAQMVLCGVTIMAGAALLALFLLRARQSHRQTQKELELLRAKAEAAEQLNAQTRALAHRQRLESIGTLTSGIAHEFNNLLTPIMGYSILILEKLPPEDTESYDNALEIYNAAQKAKKIIARLSNLSRKEAPSAFRPVRLEALVEQVLEVSAPVRPRGVEVETGLSDRGRPVLGDETQLFQLTFNLVLNSFEALAAKGGTVRVTTSAGPGQVTLRVADNGPGIPDGVKDKIFDPFFTTKGSGKGIGLGLAIVQQIVEAHGGTITLESAVGQGTAFTVAFPAAPPEEEGPPQT